MAALALLQPALTSLDGALSTIEKKDLARHERDAGCEESRGYHGDRR
jgi:hypothetical protein